MVRMPDITPGSFIPDRNKFTAGRIFRTTLLTAVSIGAIGTSGMIMGRALSAGASHVDRLYSIANTFGTDMFRDVRTEVIAGSVVGIIMIPIFICIALAGANKGPARLIKHVDDEWYS